MRARFLCCLSLAALTVPAVVPAAPVMARSAQAAGMPPVRVMRVLVTPAPEASRPACDACADWLQCEDALHRAGASVQVVGLKNGLMRIYTADSPAHARLVQALIARHDEFVRSLDAAGETAHLCALCRMTRGAALSGKLVRQVVPVENGCITITTSPDSGVVTMIRSQAPTAPLARSQGPAPTPVRSGN